MHENWLFRVRDLSRTKPPKIKVNSFILVFHFRLTLNLLFEYSSGERSQTKNLHLFDIWSSKP